MESQSYLDRLADQITKLDISDVPRLADVLLAHEGNIVFTGVGKSGHLARRVASTFALIGLQSVFVPTSDLLHGDLGLLREFDILAVVSNSGDTPEINSLLDSLTSVRVLAITSSRYNPLSRRADYILCTGLVAEVYPGIPSTSLSCASALCDCLTGQMADLCNPDIPSHHPGCPR